MAREAPRTADEIDAELDAWLGQRQELQATLSGLRESLQSLQSRVPQDGTFPLPAGLTTKLEKLETQLTAGEAELVAANRTIAALTARLDDLSAAPQPAPRPADDPPPSPQNEPPAPRQTRTGLNFL